MKKLSSLALARFCRDFALDKKATDPLILDVRAVSSLSDYYVICSVASEPQLKAIAHGLEKELKEKHGLRPFAVDGYPISQWIVVDFGSVMLHIFHEKKRGHYALEALWGDAPKVS
jgi:ribosome-associated protein